MNEFMVVLIVVGLICLGYLRAGTRPKCHEMLGCNIIKIDARGCMAQDHRVMAIGIVVKITNQRTVIPGAQVLHIAECIDPRGDYKPFTVLVERCWRRQHNLYVEET